ncbi:hypothetical protein [Xanthomonas fragariae]|uniref:hypothetical protein n=1 Tax=Xanthomonas fragariae TaxID=48664 RepID=UPI000A35C30D|nr:hypothetical protein [Xanthomonas fragariae]SMQ95266.1 hypothetical protein NBC2815_01926 [Xanthomonas fragariae]
MESARDKYTGEIIDAEQLWIMNSVNDSGYMCIGCIASVIPCSYLPENKVRAHFKIKDKHETDCDIDGDERLVKRALKQRVTTKEGFPGRFPNRLVLRDARPVTGSNGSPAVSTASNGTIKNVSDVLSEARRERRWAANTIRPICRTFINFPFDRDLSLAISGIAANTYQRIFLCLNRDKVVKYNEPHIFYAPIAWKAPASDDNQIEIQLSYGEWKDRKLVNPYRLRVNWKNWSAAKRNYISKDIEISRLESIAAKNSDSKKKGWLFFIGRQDEEDLTLFHVDDHRLICCFVVEMVYPPRPTESTAKKWPPRRLVRKNY